MLEFYIFENGGIDVAVASAENYRKLRARGYMVRKTIDCWIASFCMLRGYELLHRDRDFEPFERELGLKVIQA
jgi:predicted nucleic acid-binding protein